MRGWWDDLAEDREAAITAVMTVFMLVMVGFALGLLAAGKVTAFFAALFVAALTPAGVILVMLVYDAYKNREF